jgi:hypothetical protein
MDLILALLPVLIAGAPLILWIAMLVHVVQHDIPDKALWVLILILGNIFGGIIYYFAVYKKLAKKGKGLNKRSAVTLVSAGLVVLAFNVIILLYVFSSSPSLHEISLGQVIQEVNNGRIERIEVKGDELLILRKGDTQPSARSHKESGSSLREQGVNTDKIDIVVR